MGDVSAQRRHTRAVRALYTVSIFNRFSLTRGRTLDDVGDGCACQYIKSSILEVLDGTYGM